MLMPMIIIVIPMPPSAIMISPVMVVVVFAVPMSFMQHPAFAVVVIVRMRPVCTFKWWTLPMPPHPSVAVTHRLPIAFNPHQPCTGRRPRLFINHRRRRRPNVHRNLRRTRRDHGGREQYAIHPMQSHLDLLIQAFLMSKHKNEWPACRAVYTRPELQGFALLASFCASVRNQKDLPGSHTNQPSQHRRPRDHPRRVHPKPHDSNRARHQDRKSEPIRHRSPPQLPHHHPHQS